MAELPDATMTVQRAPLDTKCWLRVGENWLRLEHVVSVRFTKLGAILPTGACENHWIFHLLTVGGRVFETEAVGAEDANYYAGRLGLPVTFDAERFYAPRFDMRRGPDETDETNP